MSMNTPEINTYIESLIAENKALRAKNLELRSQLNHILDIPEHVDPLNGV